LVKITEWQKLNRGKSRNGSNSTFYHVKHKPIWQHGINHVIKENVHHFSSDPYFSSIHPTEKENLKI
jgi:hypothetical protein